MDRCRVALRRKPADRRIALLPKPSICWPNSLRKSYDFWWRKASVCAREPSLQHKHICRLTGCKAVAFAWTSMCFWQCRVSTAHGVQRLPPPKEGQTLLRPEDRPRPSSSGKTGPRTSLQRVSCDGTDESGESYSEKAARRTEKGLHSAGPFIRSHSD
jgi:hypothetical protein